MDSTEPKVKTDRCEDCVYYDSHEGVCDPTGEKVNPADTCEEFVLCRDEDIEDTPS